MQIKIIGVGSDYSTEVNQSILLQESGKNFLINCGYNVLTSLIENKLISRIDRIFVSNRESAYAGGLEGFLSYRSDVIQKKTKFYGLVDNLIYLRTINKKFESNLEKYFILNEEDVINTIPVAYKDGVYSEAFFNFGLLYTGPTSDSLLETAQARDARIIIHDVSFSDGANNHIHFNKLARAADSVKNKTWLIGYNKNENLAYDSKVRNHGFAGILTKDMLIKI